jgi:adenine-specific DNA-methyltransferase
MPRRSTRRSGSTQVETFIHRGQRTNIPTAELQNFLTDEERTPKAVNYLRGSELLFPRDPAGDPQLVWRGKDKQDRDPFEVTLLPIYIQEKIHPKALIDELRTEKQKADPQASLFSDFNGLEFDDLVEFYQHHQSWVNRMILGDSLNVMTSLAEKEGLKGLVQMVYVDPPYGIKFGSNWQVSSRDRDVTDGKAADATRQPEQVKAFRDTWEDGIHSYLAYLRDRFQVSRNLLAETGAIVVQIGEANVHLVRALLDEVFGRTNFAGCIVFFKTSSESTAAIPGVCDYLLVYARDRDRMKLRPLLSEKRPGQAGAKQYTKVVSPDFKTIRNMTQAELAESAPIPAGWEVCQLGPTTSMGVSEGRSGPYTFEGRAYPCPRSRHWSLDPSPGGAMDRLAALGRLRSSGKSLRTVLLARDNPTTPLDNVWLDTGTGSFTEDQIYVVQTAEKVVRRILLMLTDPGDLVLDPTCGGGTTAYVAEQWGRRWITIDTSRVAMALARQRLMAARYPYYILADSPAGARMLAERAGRPELGDQATSGDLRKGLVYKTLPHITLTDIADNPDLRPGMSKEAMDKTIAKRAEQVVLYDQPEQDSRIVRVSGPFTVESLSPHVGMPAGEADIDSGTDESAEASRFRRTVLEHLKVAGVQNTVRKERLEFIAVDDWPGQRINAIGEFEEAGTAKRAAISIGPQYGTVDEVWVREAAIEASRSGFDLLVVCGLAFDAYIAGGFKQLGSLPVLKATVNPDISMGEALLKKTASANMFTVFGEPDIEVRRADGKWVVQIRGVDVYDPTTGQIRAHSINDIACWFVDTDYNGQSFFVRHAYFLGGNDPYESLREALHADIDAEIWESLYTATSRPFSTPSTARIAVKVINHYGDEVMQVYQVPSGT